MKHNDFKRWRKSLGLSQKDAAEALGLKRRVMQYYEKGIRDGRKVKIPKTVRLACYALSVGVEDYEGPSRRRTAPQEAAEAEPDKNASSKASATKDSGGGRPGPDSATPKPPSADAKDGSTATKPAASKTSAAKPEPVKSEPVKSEPAKCQAAQPAEAPSDADKSETGKSAAGKSETGVSSRAKANGVDPDAGGTSRSKGRSSKKSRDEDAARRAA